MVNRFFMAMAFTSLLTAAPASAADYPKEVYDATYSMQGPQGTSSMRMVSDGAGKLLTSTKAAGAQYSSIIDYTKMTSTTLIEQGKMAMVSKLTEASKYTGDESSIKKLGGKSLGSKVVAGHPCHGWEYTNSGAKSETWIGDDVKLMVQSTTSSSGGKTVMTLQSISKAAPPANLFKVPAGYKIMTQ